MWRFINDSFKKIKYVQDWNGPGHEQSLRNSWALPSFQLAGLLTTTKLNSLPSPEPRLSWSCPWQLQAITSGHTQIPSDCRMGGEDWTSSPALLWACYTPTLLTWNLKSSLSPCKSTPGFSSQVITEGVCHIRSILMLFGSHGNILKLFRLEIWMSISFWQFSQGCHFLKWLQVPHLFFFAKEPSQSLFLKRGSLCQEVT